MTDFPNLLPAFPHTAEFMVVCWRGEWEVPEL